MLALPTQSPLWLSLAAVFALASGWAAARIVYTELAQSRREAATDRAAQAQAYRSMFAERASEHAEFTTAMTDRMVRRDRDVAELEDSVVEAEKRAIEAEARVQREARRANEAQERVQELTERVEELEIRKAEEDDELATWHSDLDDDQHGRADRVGGAGHRRRRGTRGREEARLTGPATAPSGG